MGYIVLLADVVFQIVKLYRPIGSLGYIQTNTLVVTHPNGLFLALLVEFPVESFVFPLLPSSTQEGRDHGNSVDAVRNVRAGQFATGW